MLSGRVWTFTETTKYAPKKQQQSSWLLALLFWPSASNVPGATQTPCRTQATVSHRDICSMKKLTPLLCEPRGFVGQCSEVAQETQREASTTLLAFCSDTTAYAHSPPQLLQGTHRCGCPAERSLFYPMLAGVRQFGTVPVVSALGALHVQHRPALRGQGWSAELSLDTRTDLRPQRLDRFFEQRWVFGRRSRLQFALSLFTHALFFRLAGAGVGAKALRGDQEGRRWLLAGTFAALWLLWLREVKALLRQWQLLFPWGLGVVLLFLRCCLALGRRITIQRVLKHLRLLLPLFLKQRLCCVLPQVRWPAITKALYKGDL